MILLEYDQELHDEALRRDAMEVAQHVPMDEIREFLKLVGRRELDIKDIASIAAVSRSNRKEREERGGETRYEEMMRRRRETR